MASEGKGAEDSKTGGGKEEEEGKSGGVLTGDAAIVDETLKLIAMNARWVCTLCSAFAVEPVRSARRRALLQPSVCHVSRIVRPLNALRDV